VGSLKPSIGVGALLVCDDFWCPADLRRVYPDFRAHFMPGFDAALRDAVVAAVRAAGHHPLPHGTYGNAAGPRFETKAEIRMMAAYADVVGMTAAHEATATGEVGLPYAILCCVDNFANGVGQEALTLDAFHAAQAANLVTVEACVGAILARVPAAMAKPAAPAAPAPAAAGAASSGAGAMPAAAGGPTSVDLVVHGRWVVTMAPGREAEVLDRHSLVVLAGVIHDIVPTAEAAALYAPTRVVTLGDDHVLMPGLVNAHTHLALSLLRGVADDLPLATWLSEQIWPTEARLVDAAFVRTGTRAALAELIRGGVTTVNDMYWFPGDAAEVLAEVGVRGVVAMVVLEFPSHYAANADEYLAKGRAIRDAWATRTDAGAKLVTFGFGPHAPYTVSDATFGKIADAATELGARVHVHLHETAGEVLASRTGGKEGTSRHLSDALTSPLDNLARLGLVNDRLVAVHMTALEDADVARLAAAGAHVVHCPTSNLKLASGFCPVAKLVHAGVNVAIGTDSASSNNALDMFAEMKLAAILAKGVAGDATAVPAWQAIRMATLNGARAIGLGDVTGSLEVGKAADFIAVKLGGRPETGPMFSVLSHLAYATDRSAVTDVWVAGAQLLADRSLTTIDEAAVLGDLREWGGRVRPGNTAEHRDAAIAPEFRRPLCCGRH
jgi:5-methylthioadenosine/S-adenosylhomocysteine deaminase